MGTIHVPGSGRVRIDISWVRGRSVTLDFSSLEMVLAALAERHVDPAMIGRVFAATRWA